MTAAVFDEIPEYADGATERMGKTRISYNVDSMLDARRSASWFALALPDLRWFLAFEAADVAVFVTRFAWFGSFSGPHNGWTNGVTYTYFEVALLARAAVLIGCVFAFLLRAPPRRAEERMPVEPQAEAMAA